MADSSTIEIVQEIMTDVFDADDLSINETTTADDVDGWDSLSHIRLIVAIERRFHIKFSNQEVAKLKNVGDLVGMIEAKRAKI